MPPSPAPPPPPSSPQAGPPSRLISREALGFWFLGLGALGLVRGWMRATRHGGFDTETVGLLWLGGSALLVLVGAVRIWRALRIARR
ncbi:hypothetical protein [Lysobacter enzymogenes]|uniref:DUF202 domain-containing protein n=1 Tax=Lysobacter enzymogenes TaxID=69 RepID=A0AAU9ALI3_LYSEN|nr:hypothetical protein [Lysobacter enzymogenes]BAV96998.1 conserved hypothetical protein [Lysobacter enzymogenes]